MRPRLSAPVLSADGAYIRPLRASDAAPLVGALNTSEVARFIQAPPSTVPAFRRYTEWAERERRAGRHLALAVVPHGAASPVGLFQLRPHHPAWQVAEWGFVFTAASWGSGLFMRTAPFVVDYAVDVLGVQRLEARVVAGNGRGNGALAKVGAVCEAVLCQSFEFDGQRLDQRLWTIVAAQWKARDLRLGWNCPYRLRLSPGGAK